MSDVSAPVVVWNRDGVRLSVHRYFDGTPQGWAVEVLEGDDFGVNRWVRPNSMVKEFSALVGSLRAAHSERQGGAAGEGAVSDASEQSEGLAGLRATAQTADRAQFEPTEADFVDPRFDALWQIVKRWEVLWPNGLRSGATGNDVVRLLRALDAVRTAAPAPSAGDAPPAERVEGWACTPSGNALDDCPECENAAWFGPSSGNVWCDNDECAFGIDGDAKNRDGFSPAAWNALARPAGSAKGAAPSHPRDDDSAESEQRPRSQAGKAADCKSAIPGSSPGGGSTLIDALREVSDGVRSAKDALDRIALMPAIPDAWPLPLDVSASTAQDAELAAKLRGFMELPCVKGLILIEERELLERIVVRLSELSRRAAEPWGGALCASCGRPFASKDTKGLVCSCSSDNTSLVPTAELERLRAIEACCAPLWSWMRNCHPCELDLVPEWQALRKAFWSAPSKPESAAAPRTVFGREPSKPEGS